MSESRKFIKELINMGLIEEIIFGEDYGVLDFLSKEKPKPPITPHLKKRFKDFDKKVKENIDYRIDLFTFLWDKEVKKLKTEEERFVFLVTLGKFFQNVFKINIIRTLHNKNKLKKTDFLSKEQFQRFLKLFDD